MKKTILTLSTALMFSGALVGCAANNAAGPNPNRNNNMRNVGYYTNPARNNVNNYPYVADRTRNDDYGINDRDMRYANQNNTATKIAKKVSRINGVEDAHVLVRGNTVIVGVNATKGSLKNPDFINDVTKTAQQYAPGKDVRVTTDRNIVKRIQNVNYRLRTGGTWNEVSSDVTGIINDLGNAAKRPFQNNVRR
ncbi:YhcN/YlaJ family sporulation lipoprotein [Scopulibacillus cellulosilyticus]|uniref:YhcN/YlaJ family sporulation lipoprotein n=1 Tax=Scopulibacillus cellulosilyticus TaxID=2665665 RepID=A0ABW2PUU4_9BACL